MRNGEREVCVCIGQGEGAGTVREIGGVNEMAGGRGMDKGNEVEEWDV